MLQLDVSLENVGGHFNKFTAVEPAGVDTIRSIYELQVRSQTESAIFTIIRR